MEKRLGLIIEHLKRPQKTMITIKSGMLKLFSHPRIAHNAQYLATTLYPRRPIMSSRATLAAWRAHE